LGTEEPLLSLALVEYCLLLFETLSASVDFAGASLNLSFTECQPKLQNFQNCHQHSALIYVAIGRYFLTILE